MESDNDKVPAFHDGDVMVANSTRSEEGRPRVSDSDSEYMNRNGGGAEKSVASVFDYADDEEVDAESKRIPVAHHKFNARNGKIEEDLASRAGKRHAVEVGKPAVASSSEYDSMISMFDEFAAANGRGSEGGGGVVSSGYGYEVGDMVWGKVKSHPWWPGHLYSEAFASPSVCRSKREGHVLVAFFGDSSYGWFDPAELIPFDPNFDEKSKQTSSRTFVKAVEEAVDEVGRRRSMGLLCRCRNPYNFRPTNVPGYTVVEVVEYEAGAVYPDRQIMKARDGFQTREALDFIKQLALAPTSTADSGSIHFIRNKASVLAYRKAVYEEFDETYAQAFGHQPVRPTRGPQDVAQPSRAPLSGPLVIAEALGKGKNSAKSNKAKQAKKERYLFKRRDEPNDLKSPKINERQAIALEQRVFLEGSSAVEAGDNVLQKRAPAVSVKPHISGNNVQSGTTGDVNCKDEATLDRKHTGSKSNISESQINASKVESAHSGSSAGESPSYSNHLPEAWSSLDKGKGSVVEKKGALESSSGRIRQGVSGLVQNMPYTSETSVVTIEVKNEDSTVSKSVEGSEQLQPATVELQGGEQVPEGSSGASGAKDHAGDTRMRTDIGVKRAKVRKRPIEELNSEKSAPREKKKKRKKEVLNPDGVPVRGSSGKSGAMLGKVTGKAVQVTSATREDFQLDHRKDDRASTSVGTLQVSGTEYTGVLELPGLLRDLQALALNPFHFVERSPAVVRQVFLRFRSLVYQKSGASLQSADNELNENRASRSPALAMAHENAPSESARDLPSSKPSKPAVRPDDPTKGGRKRGPSDRQEEMAAKKKKKISDIKTVAAEKKVSLKIPDAQRGEGRETVIPPPKSVKPVSFKKTDPPPLRIPNPTMLVMKFPPNGSLPSLNELKARFARFGPLDPSGTRVFWKSLTCRVIYRYKGDAVTAYKFVEAANNLFGNANVRAHIREVGAEGPESEPGKVQREEAALQFRDSAVEQRPGGVTAPQRAVQLKSILKKTNGEEAGTVGGINGGRGSPRVKFMLGGEEEYSRGGQLTMMVGNKNNFNNNASFADGGASSSSTSTSTSTTHAMEFSSKNFQKVIPPLASPVLPLPTAQFPPRPPPNNLHYNEVALPAPPPKNAHNINNPVTSQSNLDITQQMLSLLTRCNDVVTNVTGILGYVPYHPL